MIRLMVLLLLVGCTSINAAGINYIMLKEALPHVPNGSEPKVRITCEIGQLDYNDFIIFPGMKGASNHPHWYIAAQGITEKTTFADLKNLPTTCTGGWLNSAIYFSGIKNTIDQTVEKPLSAMIYYVGGFGPDTWKNNKAEHYTRMPDGLVLLAGSPTIKLLFEDLFQQGKLDASCTNPGAKRLNPDSEFLPVCPAESKKVVIRISFPACLQKDAFGFIRLDSPNHRDHAAYPGVNDFRGAKAVFEGNTVSISNVTYGTLAIGTQILDANRKILAKITGFGTGKGEGNTKDGTYQIDRALSKPETSIIIRNSNSAVPFIPTGCPFTHPFRTATAVLLENYNNPSNIDPTTSTANWDTIVYPHADYMRRANQWIWKQMEDNFIIPNIDGGTNRFNMEPIMLSYPKFIDASE